MFDYNAMLYNEIENYQERIFAFIFIFFNIYGNTIGK